MDVMPVRVDLAPEDPVSAFETTGLTTLALIDESLARLGSPFSMRREERRARIRAEVEALISRATEALRREREAARTTVPRAGVASDATAQLERSIALASALAEASMAKARIFAEQRTQQEATSAIAAAAQELVASVGGIAEQADGVARDVGDAKGRAARGQETSSAAFAEMRRLGHQVADASGRVENLARTLQRVIEMAGMIETIAAQTNLLALNATIEAARAGEAGKGFAVVAGEVKNLSKQTAKATEEIRGVIGEARVGMEAVLTAMRSAKDSAVEVESRLGSLAEDSAALAAGMDRAASGVDNISGILGEQSLAANQVAASMAEIAARSKDALAAAKSGVEAGREAEKLALAEVNELFERDIPHKVVRIARLDHLLWKKRLGDMQAGLLTLKPDELASDEACRLGKWYFGPASLPYRKLPAYGALARPHKAVHVHGKAAAEAFSRGDRDAVARELGELDKASKEVLAQLSALLKQAEEAGIRG
jgi:methyl-accepting chemotaxis protein